MCFFVVFLCIVPVLPNVWCVCCSFQQTKRCLLCTVPMPPNIWCVCCSFQQTKWCFLCIIFHLHYRLFHGLHVTDQLDQVLKEHKSTEINRPLTIICLIIPSTKLFLGARIACWLQCRTRDQKVASLNLSRSGRRIFFSRVNFVCWLLFAVRSYPVLLHWNKRSRSFCQKSWWQVTPEHTYTLNPTKSEWADYAAVQA